jgi:hypothetical protein
MFGRFLASIFTQSVHIAIALRGIKTGLRFFANITDVWKVNYEDKIAGKRK